MPTLSSSALPRPVETDSLPTSMRSHSRGFNCSRLRTALSALASDGISYTEIAEPAVSFGELMDRHFAAQLATADAVVRGINAGRRERLRASPMRRKIKVAEPLYRRARAPAPLSV